MSHNVTPKQLQAIHLLTAGKSAMEIAKKLKLRRETLSRWKKIPEFNIVFEQVVGELRHGLQYRLLTLADTSISTIEEQFSRYYAADCDAKRVQMALNFIKMMGISSIMLPDGTKRADNASITIDNAIQAKDTKENTK